MAHNYQDVIDFLEAAIRENQDLADKPFFSVGTRSMTGRDLLKEVMDETELGVRFAKANRKLRAGE